MREPSLRQLQQWLKSQIRPGLAAGTATSFAPSLNPQRDVPGEARLSVYVDGYVARIQEALAEVYEGVAHVLGDEAFTELAHQYAARYPSHDYNLSFAGRLLPQFLADWPLTKQLPFLPDLARLEWAVCQAFHAFDQTPGDLSRLAAASVDAWDRAQLIFQPSVAIVDSAWPLLDLWQARQQLRSKINIDLVNRPQCVLVFRRELRVRCERIDQPQRLLLQGLLEGRPLGLVCSELASQWEDAPPLTDWFSQWVRYGLIIRCEMDTSASR